MINTWVGRQMQVARKRYAILLIGYFMLAYLLPLGARDLLVPDETRYAEIPREMIASGNWMVPHLNGLRYFEKPPMGYWVQAGAIMLFGQNNFAVRLPSAVAVGLTAVLIWTLVGALDPGPAKEAGRAAALAVLVFFSCFEVAGVGNIAVLDSLFAFFLTAALTAFYWASESPPGSTGENGFLLLAGMACGLAFLTKGFLALALPVLVLVPYLIWQRRVFDVLRMSWLPAAVAVLVALPWSLSILSREPDFWRFFFWNEHIRRFMADNAQHGASFWYYFLAAPGLCMPWTFVIPAAVPRLRPLLTGCGRPSRLVRFGLCWLVVPFLFFSASNGKLLTYVLPCFPPLAVLMAIAFWQPPVAARNKAFQWGTAATGLLVGLVMLALIGIQIFGYRGLHPYSQPWKATMVINGLLLMVFFCFWSARRPSAELRIVLLGLSPLLLLFLAHFAVPDMVIAQSAPGRMLEKHCYRISPDTVIIAGEDAVGTVCWTFKRDDLFVLGPAGELTYGLHYKDAMRRLLDVNTATRLIQSNRGRAVLVARTDKISAWRHALPPPVQEDETGLEGYTLWWY